MNIRDTLKNALKVLNEVALDLVNTQLAEYRQMYRGGYKPHRVAQAEAEVKAVEDAITDLRAAVAATDLPECVADSVQKLKQLADNYAWVQGGGEALRGDLLPRMELFAALDSFGVRMDSPPCCPRCTLGVSGAVKDS
jgi:hypothetical protein